MSVHILQELFDTLHKDFKGMGDSDLSKEDRIKEFYHARETIEKIDNVMSYAKGIPPGGFSFSSILHMSKLPPLKEDDAGFNEAFSEFMKKAMEDVEDLFSNLKEEDIESILKGQYEHEPQEQKGGLPVSLDGGDDPDAEEDVPSADAPNLDKETQRLLKKIEKTFVRMGSAVDTEAESAYRQTYGWMKKAEAGNKQFDVSFSKFLDESSFESRLMADLKGFNIDFSGYQVPEESSSKDLIALPRKKARSISEVVSVVPKEEGPLPQKVEHKDVARTREDAGVLVGSNKGESELKRQEQEPLTLARVRQAGRSLTEIFNEASGASMSSEVVRHAKPSERDNDRFLLFEPFEPE